ncbi:AAA family ATPase [Neorhizobium sp. T25_13]|uniref:AAA family ATPase n=1 Tax=Neorhizobium sp. T25_13 TaxID=2093830 RepID=UPI000CFA6427|nr:AAA family ATPase [Neorhizobium sp. T25_13]
MIERVEILNYKSITDLKLSLGAINVFIGENGAGKSNILEALALAGAAEARKLDNEFLASRGIRVTAADFMRSAFSDQSSKEPISITVSSDDGNRVRYTLTNDNKPYSSWTSHTRHESVGDIGIKSLTDFFVKYLDGVDEKQRKEFLAAIQSLVDADGEVEDAGKRLKKSFEVELKIEPPKLMFGSAAISDFIIFSPENTALRMFEREGQIEPLGINGEGLLKLLTVMSRSRDKRAISAVKESLKLFSWFEDFKIPRDNSRREINIMDTFIGAKTGNFDQRSANEGFLFVAFYFALFSSSLTPKFFAIDNIDASLNPKLCRELMVRLAMLSAENEKQAILTTHNPAILDGMNLDDDSQRLFIVSRSSEGHTKVRRFKKKNSGALPSKLSEMFLSGAIGALPKGF